MFGVLGALVVSCDGVWVRISGARRRSLLCRLVMARGRPVPVEVLAEDLWEGRPPAGAKSTLQSHMSLLRQLLGVQRVVHRDGGYLLVVDPGEVDVAVFERGRSSWAEPAGRR